MRKQTELAGFESKKIPEIEAVLAPYVEALYERMELQEREKAAKEALHAEMERREIPVYRWTDGDYSFTVELEERSSRVKVKREKLVQEED